MKNVIIKKRNAMIFKVTDRLNTNNTMPRVGITMDKLFHKEKLNAKTLYNMQY